MKALIGILFIIAGIILGIYLGPVLCFYGGIVAVIGGIKAGWIASTIALGIIRILCTGLVGWGTFIICSVIGGAFIQSR